MRCKIGDLITDIAAGPFGSNLKTSCFVESGFPIIDGANLKGFKVTDNITKFVTEEKARSLHRSIAKRLDVIVTISGTVGQIAYIPDDSAYEEYLCSQRQFRATFDKNKVNPIYLTYYFHTSEGQHKILSFVSQVGVPALSQPLKNFRNIEINLPSLETQNRIAKLLLSIDNKINNNNSINGCLEAQINALFESELLKFGDVPGGWKKTSLIDIADYTNGLAMQKYRPDDGIGIPVLKIKELRQGFCDSESDRCSADIESCYHVFDGDVIFSWSGSLLVDFWCGGHCGLNQHLFKVTSNKYEKWFYYIWTKYYESHFAAIAAGMATTMGHIKRGELEKAEALVPNAKDMERLKRLFEPLCDDIIRLRLETKKLIETRDELLPKLMFGEIDVDTIEVG